MEKLENTMLHYYPPKALGKSNLVFETRIAVRVCGVAARMYGDSLTFETCKS